MEGQVQDKYLRDFGYGQDKGCGMRLYAVQHMVSGVGRRL